MGKSGEPTRRAYDRQERTNGRTTQIEVTVSKGLHRMCLSGIQSGLAWIPNSSVRGMAGLYEIRNRLRGLAVRN
jgi:hypothetical protein